MSGCAREAVAARGGAAPRLRSIANPSLPSNVTLHQPASHSPTSIDAPFGIAVTMSLLVPGAARRLVSPDSVTGLAMAALLSAIRLAAMMAVRESMRKPRD